MAKTRGEQRQAARVYKAQASLREPDMDRVRLKVTDAEMDAAEGETWFVLEVGPGRVNHAVNALNAIGGLDAFAPLERRRIRKSKYRPNEYRNITVPIYPGYVFLGVSPQAYPAPVGDGAGLPWQKIEGIGFVKRYLCDPLGRPVEIETESVLALMRKCRKNPLQGRDREEEEAPFCPVILPGWRVRVTTGPLEGWEFVPDRLAGGEARVKGISPGSLTIPFNMLKRVS